MKEIDCINFLQADLSQLCARKRMKEWYVEFLFFFRCLVDSRTNIGAHVYENNDMNITTVEAKAHISGMVSALINRRARLILDRDVPYLRIHEENVKCVHQLATHFPEFKEHCDKSPRDGFKQFIVPRGWKRYYTRSWFFDGITAIGSSVWVDYNGMPRFIIPSISERCNSILDSVPFYRSLCADLVLITGGSKECCDIGAQIIVSRCMSRSYIKEHPELW